ncbi:site-specific integrase [Pseudomonas moraviensis]|nr:site-specific integrase [Pseudomonas moraviensis]
MIDIGNRIRNSQLLRSPTYVKRLSAPHVDLLETVRDGRRTFRLLSDDKIQNTFFDSWAYQISRKLKYKTVSTYCYAVKTMLNYVAEVALQSGGLTPGLLADALENYESFLVFGTSSSTLMVRKAARVLGDRNLSGSSVVTHFAGVNRFIDASEMLRRGMVELEERGAITSASLCGFSLQTTVKINAPEKVRSAIKSNSWLAGCIVGGAKRIKSAGLSPISKPSGLAFTDDFGGDELTFPIDKCVELIKKAPSLRDKVLWSLIAATGCRVSEALTMLMCDVAPNANDYGSSKVFIVDPATRREVLINYISEEDINQLSHKGRAHTETYMIEPFASMFWIALAEYKQAEREKEKKRLAPVTHKFLFRNVKNGDPMPLSYQTVYERFTKVALQLTGEAYGFHSLRHMYGYYLVNHCVNPNPNSSRRYGLDLHQVQRYMGHSQISTTKRYARQDAQMLHATLAAINLAKLGGGPRTVREARIAYLKHELSILENQILEAA